MIMGVACTNGGNVGATNGVTGAVTVQPGSSAIDPANAATDDILGRTRGAAPDVGAVELP